jgi:hypothetical protein
MLCKGLQGMENTYCGAISTFDIGLVLPFMSHTFLKLAFCLKQ